MEPLTEHRLVSGPVVYGFLRLVRASEARQVALVASLTEYCRSHELELSGVFTERKAGAGPGSAAFSGLLDVLALPDVYGVLAPAASHLGPKAIAAERGRRIKAVGSRLLLVRRAHPACPPDAAPAVRSVQPPEGKTRTSSSGDAREPISPPCCTAHLTGSPISPGVPGALRDVAPPEPRPSPIHSIARSQLCARMADSSRKHLRLAVLYLIHRIHIGAPLDAP
ncbi:hypothetical protein [Streptomyces sp. NPDC053720]|uniref:hypothetical protein n=1 Tax=Streptomyces sp. NPDC053720 TaxID=3154855 RepID=UPI0034330FC8